MPSDKILRSKRPKLLAKKSTNIFSKRPHSLIYHINVAAGTMISDIEPWEILNHPSHTDEKFQDNRCWNLIKYRKPIQVWSKEMNNFKTVKRLQKGPFNSKQFFQIYDPVPIDKENFQNLSPNTKELTTSCIEQVFSIWQPAKFDKRSKDLESWNPKIKFHFHATYINLKIPRIFNHFPAAKTKDKVEEHEIFQIRTDLTANWDNPNLGQEWIRILLDTYLEQVKEELQIFSQVLFKLRSISWQQQQLRITVNKQPKRRKKNTELFFLHLSA